MRRFLYYFPGVPGMNARMLADRGALDRFTGHGGRMIEHGVTTVANGPDGGGGCIVAAGAAPPETELVKHWHQGEKFWVAVETLPPEPADLARDVGIDGYEIALGGSAWRVPLIRRWDTERLCHVSALPQAVKTVVRDGKNWGMTGIAPEYEPLDAIADQAFVDFMAQNALPLRQAFARAVGLLAVNYRIGVEEASLLGLFDQDAIVKVMGMCIDLPKMQAQAVDFATEGLRPAEPKIEEEEG